MLHYRLHRRRSGRRGDSEVGSGGGSGSEIAKRYERAKSKEQLARRSLSTFGNALHRRVEAAALPARPCRVCSAATP